MSINFAFSEENAAAPDAGAFLQSLAAERGRLATYRETLRDTLSRSQEWLAQVDLRLQAMDAVAESYRCELPGDVGQPADEPAPSDQITVGPLRIDLGRRCAVAPDGFPIQFTNTQFRALEILALADGNDVSRDELSQKLFGRKWNGGRNIDQLVFQLKRKLPRCADGGELIRSVRGSGYWMRASFPDPDPSLLPIPPDEGVPAPPGSVPVEAVSEASLPAEPGIREETASRVEAALQPQEGKAPKPAQASCAPPTGARGNVWAFGRRIEKRAAIPAKPGDVEEAIRKFAQEKGVTACPAAIAAEGSAVLSAADRTAIAAHSRRQEGMRVAALPVRQADRKPA